MMAISGQLRRGMSPMRNAKVAPHALLISIEEFANRTGCSVSTARKLAYGRRISTVKFNKNLMVPAAEVDRLIQKHIKPALDSEEAVSA
jgi:Helix-turn-helix domain